MCASEPVTIMNSILYVPPIFASRFSDLVYAKNTYRYMSVADVTDDVDVGLYAAVHYSCLHFVEKLK